MTSVLLLNPNTRDIHGTLLTLYPPLGILYIASYLRKNGHKVQVIDADIDNIKTEEIIDQCNSIQPTIIGITTSTLQLKAAYHLATTIKENFPNVCLVAGGSHPSAVPEDVLNECEAFDIIVVGEGEITFFEIASAYEHHQEIKTIKGIYYRLTDKIVTSGPREYIENLDELPYPALDLVEPISRYPGASPVRIRPSLQLLASRGCPYRCNFCSNPVWGKRTRFFSPEYIVNEIEWLESKFGVKDIWIIDDTLNLNQEWFKKICNLLIARKLAERIYFRAPFRVNENLISKDLIKLAKKAGFWLIFFGVESGDQKILDLMNKGITTDEIARAFEICKTQNVKTYASLIIGYPGQDELSINKTVQFVKKIDPDYFGFAIAMPYPSCKMYFSLKNAGLITKKFIDYKIGEYLISSAELKKPITEYITGANVSILDYKKSWLHRLKTVFSKNSILPTPLINSNVLDVNMKILDCSEKKAKNKKFTINVLITNNSSFDLISLPPFPVHISYHWTDTNSNYHVWNGERTKIDCPLKHGEKRIMLLDIFAPSISGTFELELCFVQEGNKWISILNSEAKKYYSIL
jgi:anaerobic magnesium-protoporphyrin IX monomethyl ester cyclase